VKQVFYRFGFPRMMISDNGSQFTSKTVKKMCNQYNIDHRFLSAYHPQQNQSERVNRTMIPMIAAFVSERQTDWDNFIHEFAFAVRSAIHDSTGVSPAILNLGRELPVPFDRNFQSANDSFDLDELKRVPERLQNLIESVRVNLKNSRERNKKYYDE